MPIRLPVYPAFRLFRSDVPAFDVVQGRDEFGRPLDGVVEADRIIPAVIQPAGDRAVDLTPAGAESTAEYTMHTPAAISAADNVQDGMTNRQTFVRHNGNVWKVWKIQDWRPHQKIARYVLTRYVNLNGNYS